MFTNSLKNWKYEVKRSSEIYYKGSSEFADSISNIDKKNIDINLYDALKKNKEFTSGYIETSTYSIAWVDHIRSWPIFYTSNNNNFHASNNARSLKGEDIDEISSLEFALSGYIAGANTLYKNIKCLQPGEFLIWDKAIKSLNVKRYYQYLPNMIDTTQSWEENKGKLDEILDQLTRKMIINAQGRPIWVPLSGGLDSRILLCKLHEHKYPNIHSFTYGPMFNFESKIAKKVAQKLNVPWHFISPSKKQIRKYFSSQDRKDFWYSTDGYKAIASMREFSALMNLREKKLIPDNAVLLNGQSGDYITGNHISELWLKDKKFSSDDLFQVLINKHYDLWKSLRSDENFNAIKKRIIDLLPKEWEQAKTGLDFATLEEIWEYDARQVCLVANGQKSYDYFGYDWEMPLWDKVLVDFCEKLPLDQKIGQSLYKNYLKDYNYLGLFAGKEPYIWRWPLLMLWVIPVAQLIGYLRGRQAKDNFYALMRYHGHYSNQFYAFPSKTHKKTYAIARNVMSLNVRQFIIENSKLFPQKIIDKLVINDVD